MSPAEGLRTALEIYELAVAMLRTHLLRERPEITDAELDAAVFSWVRDRSGAPHGDADGRPRALGRTE